MADQPTETAQGSPVSPSDGPAAWDEWATFSRNVTEALGQLPERPLFSRRNAVARALWDMGYRPTAEQVEAEREKDRQRRDACSGSLCTPLCATTVPDGRRWGVCPGCGKWMPLNRNSEIKPHLPRTTTTTTTTTTTSPAREAQS